MLRMPCGTASGRRSPTEWLPALTLACVLAVPASANVVVREKTVSEGLGWSNGSTTRTLIVSGDKCRSDAAFVPAGATRPRESSSILRLDKALVWRIDPEKQQYVEMPLAALGAVETKGTKVDVDVKRAAEKQTINGFPCEHVIVTATAANERIVVDRWLVAADGPVLAEIAGFFHTYGELTVRRALRDLPPEAWAGYGPALDAVGQKLAELPGVALRSTLTIEDARRRDSKGKPDSAPADDARYTWTTDVQSINNDTPPPGTFDIPPGFKLVKPDAAKP